MLLVDIGNTRVKWTNSTTSKRLDNVKAFNYESDNITAALDTYWTSLAKPKIVAISCVVRHLEQEIRDWVEHRWGSTVLFAASEQWYEEIHNGYDDFKQLGIDRWLAIIGFRHKISKPYLLVDCGTGITLDVMSAKGHYEGGWILPGLQTQKEFFQSRLPLLSAKSDGVSFDVRKPQTTTQCGIEAGIMLSIVSSIESIYRSYHAKDSQFMCALTGGDAKKVSENLTVPYSLHPNLVLEGLQRVAFNHSDLVIS